MMKMKPSITEIKPLCKYRVDGCFIGTKRVGFMLQRKMVKWCEIIGGVDLNV